MRHTSLLLRIVLLSAPLTACLDADILLDLPSQSFTGSESTLTFRPFRDGVTSDWSYTKAWPGNSTAAGPFAYLTYTIPVVSVFDPTYIQISVDDPATALFVGAYQNAFVLSGGGSGTSANYLGDQGNSGNLFGNPSFFQVILPANAQLVLLVNRTLTTGGNPSFGLLVEGFSDPNFTPLPEPSPYGLGLSAVALVIAVRRKQRKEGGVAR